MKEKPEYILEDAVPIVFENISKELQEKFSPEDIAIILDMEFQYQQESELASDVESIIELPVKVDDESLEYFVINKCAKLDIIMTYDEFQEILEAEIIYLDSIGLIDEEGDQKFYN